MATLEPDPVNAGVGKLDRVAVHCAGICLRPTALPFSAAPGSPSQESKEYPMNAVPVGVVSEALPASRKVYKSGTVHPEVRVPMREISLHPSAGEPPLTVYDSSGPYTDRAVKIDIERGLPRLREGWITSRGDVEAYTGRPVQAVDNGNVIGTKGAAPEFPNVP